MRVQSNQICIENGQNQMDSMLLLCQLQQEIRGRRDKKIMCLLASQFVQSLAGSKASNRSNPGNKLVKKANELLINVQNGNYSLSMTMTGHLLDSLAHGLRQTEYKISRAYLQ